MLDELRRSRGLRPVQAGARVRVRVWTIAAGLAAVIVAAVILAAGCREAEPPPDPVAGERVPRQVLENFTLRTTGASGLLWVLQAAEGTSYAPGEPTELRLMTVRFYDGGGVVRSVLTSRRGEIDESTRTLFAQDSVVVVTPDGERLETESLRWDPRAERITTDAYFRLTKGRDVLTGTGFSADPDLRRYSVVRDVRAEVRDQDDTKILEGLDGE